MVIICAMFGMYGGCYRKKCAVTCYSFAILILFVLFAAVGVAMILFF